MQRAIGIDVGYGFVKVTDGQARHTFPSVVGAAAGPGVIRTRLRPSEPLHELVIEIEGQTHYVGAMAIQEGALAFRSLSTGRTEGNDFKVLFLTGLSLFSDKPLNSFAVVTGLPPGRMHTEKEVSAMMEGEHHVAVHRDGQRREMAIRVDRLVVVPQPLGTFWAHALDGRGQPPEDPTLLEGRVGIIDVGFRTVDLATIAAGEYVARASRTIPVGLAHAYDLIAARMGQEIGLERETYALDESVISGEVRVNGKRIDISAIRDEALRHLATKVLVEIQSFWQVPEFDLLLLTGGGGKLLAPYLLGHLSQLQLMEGPVTANSRGYVNWANRLWNPQGQNWAEEHMRPA